MPIQVFNDAIVDSIEEPKTINSVTDRGLYIELLISGPQTAETIHSANLRLEAMAADFTAKNKPLLVLAAMENISSGFNLGAFKESLKPADTIKFNRFAITGELPRTMMSIITNVVNSFEHSFDVKYFSDKDQAIAWLKDYKP